MDLYLAVGKEVAGAKNVTLGGRYVSKVYEGPFRKWCKDFEGYAKGKGLKVRKQYRVYDLPHMREEIREELRRDCR